MPSVEALARAGSIEALRMAFKARRLLLRGHHFFVAHDTDPDLGPPDVLPIDRLVPLEWLDDDLADVNFTAGRAQFDFTEVTGWGAPTRRKFSVVVIGLEVDRSSVDALWPAPKPKRKLKQPERRSLGRPRGSLSKAWQKIFPHFDVITRDGQFPNLNSAADAVEVWVEENIKKKSSRPHRRTIERVILRHRRKWIDPDWQPAKTN
jgi:hypothetical protein